MKNLKFLTLFLASLLIFSCSKDEFEEEPDVLNQIQKELFQNTENLNANSKSGEVDLPKGVRVYISEEYPESEILNVKSYETPSAGKFYFAVELSNDLEIVIFQNAYLLARATLETEMDIMEMKAGDLPWSILLILSFNYRSDRLRQISRAFAEPEFNEFKRFHQQIKFIGKQRRTIILIHQ